MSSSGQIRKIRASGIAASTDLGVSFSLIACREYGINWRDALQSTIDLGFKRFRLMSYWSEHERERGTYDFSEIDEQLAVIKKAGGRVSLCIGMRQPRWPETHLPDWTERMSEEDMTNCYLKYHRTVIERYK